MNARLLLTLLALALLSACNREPENLARASALHPAGRIVFNRNNCVRCHEQGQGGFGKRMIDNPNLTDLEFIKNRVRTGKTVGGARMPGFPLLSEQELGDVAEFVRTLAGHE